VATGIAVDDNSIVGLPGLLWKQGESTVEPVVVARDQRRAGIGRSLLETAIDESGRRSATDVNIKPVARNASAIKAFHELGFRTLGHLQLCLSQERSEDYWRDGVNVQGCRFDHCRPIARIDGAEERRGVFEGFVDDLRGR
jgi:GNAT superfamily N-acetyltransferase